MPSRSARSDSPSGGGRVPDRTDRGRVPFAVVGVLLLVSASTLAATSRTGAPATTEPAAERAIERAETAVVTALRRATREAAREAAARPLTAPADTPAGRALNRSDTDPFRASLELRLALVLDERLRHLDTRVGDVRVVARPPSRPPGAEAGVRAALDRVDVTPVGPNATALRATVRDVTLVVTRDGRRLDRVQLSPTVVVGTPVFALHERVERFEHHLHRGPLERGFARRLTVSLSAAAWARGAAQYGGAPVVNVLGTRHVELLANGALIDTQRATLGDVDARAPSALREATGRVAAADVASGVREALARANGTTVGGLSRSVVERSPDTRQRTVSVGAAADRAFANLTGGRLETVLGRAYTATVRTRVIVRRRGQTVSGGEPPDSGWSLADRQVETSWSAESLEGGVSVPRPTAGWHELATATRRVVRTQTITRRWIRDEETRRTRHTERTTYVVGLTHEGRPNRETAAPPRPVESAFVRRSNPGGGPNLADAAQTATERFDTRADPLAVRAAREGLNGTTTVAGRVPDRVGDRVLTDLVSMHRRVRNVSVTVEQGAIATLAVSPAARLAARLRERRATLVAAPERYDHVASRARVAVRAAYLDAVVARLDAQAARHRTAQRRLDTRLRATGVGSLRRLRRLAATRPERTTAQRQTSVGPFGSFEPTVSTAPVYLPTSAGTDAPPLVTRNVNLAVPYADVGDGVADVVTETLFDDRRVRLGTAARTLRSTRRVADETGNESLRRDARRLRRAVDHSLGYVSGRLRRTLRRRGVGRETRRAAVRSALAPWDDPSTRALALSNGSVVPRVVGAVARLAPRFRDPDRRLSLEAALNATRRRALRSEASRVAARPVDRTSDRLRWVARTTTRTLTERGVEAGAVRLRERLRGPLSRVPAGVPVTPVPGYWYATTNVWHVTVRGRYERLTVGARTGRPPTGTVDYVREAGVVRLDVDRDGTPERLGRTEPVAFDVSTAVVVAVPPGPRGVGDKDGNADERSAGWPEPGPSPTASAVANETTYRPPS